MLLLSTSKLHWPRAQPHVPDMRFSTLFRLVQQTCPKMCFQAWSLGKEFRELWQWCCSNLPPQLLLVEQTIPGRSVWTPVNPANALRLPVGSEVQVRCWMLGATQYTWTTTSGNTVASTEVHCTRHHTGKSEIALQSGGKYQCVATAVDGHTSDPVQFEVVSVAHEEEGTFVTRLLQNQAARLDAIVQRSLGLDCLPGNPSVADTRICAFAYGELGLSPSTVQRTPLDEGLLLRRCALPVVPGVCLGNVLEELAAAEGSIDMSMVWLDLPPEQLVHSQAVCELPEVVKRWFAPMQQFCRAHQPRAGSVDQRSKVCDLLCRCGWAAQPHALWLVLKVLRWDTVELLHFALQLLRRHCELFRVTLVDVLERTFGDDAVLPLRQALDPTLTLALIVAAPGPSPVRRRKKEERRMKNEEEEEENEERKGKRKRKRKRRRKGRRKKKKKRKKTIEKRKKKKR